MDQVSEQPDLEQEPEPTLPKGLNYSMRGFAKEEDARRLAYVMSDALHYVSRYIDLELLDGVTVAYDYREALAELDRGVADLRSLTPSEGEIIGIAMSPAVLRDGEARTHIVFGAPYMEGFLEEEPGDDFRFSLGVLAHECAHVEVHKYQERAFPGSLLRHSFNDFESAAMHEIAEVCWEEYAASRLSAVFAQAAGEAYATAVIQVSENARERARKEVVAYRTHADVRRLVFEVGGVMHLPLKCAAYLLGHLDGSETDWRAYPAARQALRRSDFADFVDDMREHLRELWARRGAWESWSAFDPLRDVARRVYESSGLYFDKDYVDVPFTPDTMWWC